ncbi:transposase [Salinibacter ruber]|uniref:transposase n=1 Tax=Salinibacter ruber TaxID=146919 RepID=UPI003C6E6D1F
MSEESFLPDEEDCAETWRALRWPDEPQCVECGSSDVALQDWDYLSSLRRYQCRSCGRWFNDRSGTCLESAGGHSFRRGSTCFGRWTRTGRPVTLRRTFPIPTKRSTGWRRRCGRPSTSGARSGSSRSPER